MSYLALYRKYRPQFFKDVVGQEIVSRVLKNQIISDNIGHAYLFSGIRGIGKTSIAKIFSRAVNCENPIDGEPCGECEVCKSLSLPSQTDILEIDAASNRGIDEIRNLKESVEYFPNIGKYKVYIIDEVHMLTKEAFNALLKTLEEPPEHVLFLLATTEPERLPATILSRCQQFLIKPLSASLIKDNLKSITDKEGIVFEDAALDEIAKRAQGSMRDGISLLDQCADLKMRGETISLDEVREFLGISNEEELEGIAKAIVTNDPERLLKILDELRKQGKSDQILLEDLAGYFKTVLEKKIQNEPVAEEFKTVGTDTLYHYIEQIVDSHAKLRFNELGQILTDTTLLLLSSGQSEPEVVPKPALVQKKAVKPKEAQAPVEQPNGPVSVKSPPDVSGQNTVSGFNKKEFKEKIVDLAQKKELGLISKMCQNADFILNKNGLFIIIEDKHKFMFETTDFSKNLKSLVYEILGHPVNVYPKLRSGYNQMIENRNKKKTLEEKVKEVTGDDVLYEKIS